MHHAGRLATQFALIVVSAPLLFGCEAWRVTDYGTESQPWAGHHTRARGEFRSQLQIELTETQYRWQTPRGRFVDAERTVERCRLYLDRSGAPITWEYLFIESGDVHGTAPLTQKTRLDFKYLEEYAAEYDRDDQSLERGVSRYDQTSIIVCVNPIVVLTVPIPTYSSFASLERVGRLVGSVDDLDMETYRPAIALPQGIDFGTSIPYHAEVLWYSPELEVGPTPVTGAREGRGRIELPWGFLVLNRKDDEWIVTTEGRSD